MSDATTRSALVLAHESDGPAGQIEARLRDRGWAVTTHVITRDFDRPNEAEPWPDWRQHDLLVVMGSVRSLTRKDEIDSWVHDEIELLRKAHDEDMPILGICFGGQLMAEALGGTVEASTTTEVGWFDITPEPEAPDALGGGPWFEWHHDCFTVPPGATLLASNDVCPQAFLINRTFGTQFHPEVDFDHVAGFLDHAPDEYLDAVGVDRADMLRSMKENEQRNIEQCHRLVDWYLDKVL